MKASRFAKSALVPILAIFAGTACGPGAKAPDTAADLLPKAHAEAFAEEASGDLAKATHRYRNLFEVAASRPGDPYALDAMIAAADALVFRSIDAFDDVTPYAALAFRTHESGAITATFADVAERGEGPFAKALAARALEELAKFRGDTKAATDARTRMGCATEATVVGPLSWASLGGLTEKDPLEAADAVLDASYPLPGAFGSRIAPVVVKDRGCAIPLSANLSEPGVRDVVVDVTVKKAGRIGLALRTNAPGILRAGGLTVIERPYEAGGGTVARFAELDAEEGTLRVVARVGMGSEGDVVEIGAWDADGAPLATHAPAPGSRGNAKASRLRAKTSPTPTTDEARALVAAAALGRDEPKTAERNLASLVLGGKAAPSLALLYGRAVSDAADLSNVHRAERARGAYERVLEAWPTSSEAILAHAELAAVRKGQGEARIEALNDLDALRAKAKSLPKSQEAILDLYEAATSGHERILDRATAAYGRAKAVLADAPLTLATSAAAFDRMGSERVAFFCATEAPHARNDFACYEARRQTGDYDGAMAELDRIRALRGGTGLYLATEFQASLGSGRTDRVRTSYGRMTPGERTLAALHAVRTANPMADPKAKKALVAELLAAATTSRDAPHALPPLLRDLGDDPLGRADAEAEAVAAADRKSTILPGAATVLLLHRQSYAIDPSGLLHATLLDVRRVSGTVDVDQNAQAEMPELSGRTTLRVLRRRILKKDGRIVEPDQTPYAQQQHADLSQLETGDVVECAYEAWALPGETGDLGFDTPDLLPSRTAVHDATIEIRMPESLRGSFWNHTLLGKPTETKEGATRVIRFAMKDREERRIEYGGPKMDMNVSASFSTTRWSDVGRALAETVKALEERDPEVSAFAESAGKGKKGKELVASVVEAVGAAVKESSAGSLSDIGIGRARGAQTSTARTILVEQEGSRTWLTVRALRHLGIDAEVVIAENEPYSADPKFPPHFGRFMHPLAVAHLPASGTKEGASGDVWIDADVSGPPLPAGRISPELRGRSFVSAKGEVTPLPESLGGTERDEVDIRLTVDEKGDARGTLTVLMRGRDAQEIAEALFRIVGEERKRALRGVALAWVPSATVDEVALSSTEASWQVAVRATLSVSAYGRIEGTPKGGKPTWSLPGLDPVHFVFPRTYVTNLGTLYATQATRETALAINTAAQYHVHRRVELPKGTTVARMPGPLDLRSKVFSAARRIAVDGTVVEDDFVLDMPTATVDAALYGAFTKDVKKTDDAFLAGTRVTPPR
ncbi:MAG: hypothetical protein U0169_09445 [Polyangiaceae bacterium]